jgi:hypothetical protein
MIELALTDLHRRDETVSDLADKEVFLEKILNHF